MKREIKSGHHAARRNEGPSVQDQLDALWAIVNTMVKSTPKAQIPSDALAVLEHVEAVKAKYPKGKS